MCKVKGRVQKMERFSKDLHEQPQKPFRLLGMTQFWWSQAGCSQKYKAVYRVA